MSKFYGFCSYPHGGWTITWLSLSISSALAATIWGVSSCRFLIVNYTTDRGDFGTFFSDPTPDYNEPTQQRVNAGLFTWLIPTNDDYTQWSDGQCAGYTTTQLDYFDDTILEVSRFFAIFATLGGICVTLSVIPSLLCLSLGRFQIWLLRIVLGTISIFTAMTFLIFASTLCTDLVKVPQEEDDGNNNNTTGGGALTSYPTHCTVDQGGLIVIAASIFWAVSSLLAIVYMKPRDADLTLQDGQITNAFEERQRQRLRREKERKMKRIMATQQRKLLQQEKQQQQQQQKQLRPSATAALSSWSLRSSRRWTKDEIASYDDEEGTEVQLGSRASTWMGSPSGGGFGGGSFSRSVGSFGSLDGFSFSGSGSGSGGGRKSTGVGDGGSPDDPTDVAHAQ